MALVKAVKPKYPARRVAIYGPSGAGKTKLARASAQPMVVVDADGRFTDQMHPDDEVYFLSDNPADNTDIDRICQLMGENIPGSEIKTVVVDTITPIFEVLIAKVDAEVDEIRENNRRTGNKGSEIAPHKYKAAQMKKLRRALFGFGTDVLIIYHQHDHYNHRGQRETAKTVSDIELARLNMSINMTLKVVIDERTQRRGLLIERNRFGHEGVTVWDDSKNKDWTGIWEKLEAEAYKGLTWADMQKKADAIPEIFTGLDHAYAWGTEQGVFNDVMHAKHALEALGIELDDPEEWSAPWLAEVQRRSNLIKAAVGDDKSKWPAYLKSQAAAKQKMQREAKAKPVAAEPEQEQPASRAPVRPTEPPFVWMCSKLSPTVAQYTETVAAAANGKIVTAAQMASLDAAIHAAAGWNPDDGETLDGLDRATWVANLLASRPEGDLGSYPAGAFTILARGIVDKMAGRVNANYNSNSEVDLVKQVAQVVDEAFAAYV